MLSSLITAAIDKVKNSQTLSELDEIKLEYLSKKGLVSLEMRKLATLPDSEKKEFGQKVNEAKSQIQNELDSKREFLEEKELNEKLAREKIDVTLPSRKVKSGSIHPITQARKELVEIFSRLGFEVKDGPNIEDDWHNFTALNIDENHPARQEHDTFYMPSKGENKFVLRTHTSPVQIRAMQELAKPPFRFIAPGRTYRSDYDQTHTPMFHQIEVLAVDENVNMQEMKYLIEKFINAFFEGQNPEVRFRPSFFPFTTPSAEVDIRFKGGNWLEVMGCGMIHPEVLKNADIDPSKYQGFAAGLGIERMAMLKYGIGDLRQFFESDIRWLEHFSFSFSDVPSISNGLTK